MFECCLKYIIIMSSVHCYILVYLAKQISLTNQYFSLKMFSLQCLDKSCNIIFAKTVPSVSLNHGDLKTHKVSLLLKKNLINGYFWIKHWSIYDYFTFGPAHERLLDNIKYLIFLEHIWTIGNDYYTRDRTWILETASYKMFDFKIQIKSTSVWLIGIQCHISITALLQRTFKNCAL